jgi:methylase of polypeptide subunit release factors
MSAAGVLRREEQGWSSAVRVSTINGLASVHSAFPTTQEDSVFFGPDTYRFVNEITGHLSACGRPIRRAVDIGCGAGPGAMTICLGRPEAEVFGVDINPEALRLARVNAYLAEVSNLVCRRSDLLRGVEGDFDLIVANPPYLIDPAKRAYRHGGGLHGAGLSLSILDSALTRLAPSGSLVLYTGSTIVNGVDGFRKEVETRLRHPEYTWRYREIDPDIFSEELLCEAYADADRIAAVVLTVNRT